MLHESAGVREDVGKPQGLTPILCRRDGRIDAIDRGMPDSQWVVQQIGRPVIKAFNNIFAKSLLEKGVPR